MLDTSLTWIVVMVMGVCICKLIKLHALRMCGSLYINEAVYKKQTALNGEQKVKLTVTRKERHRVKLRLRKIPTF